MKNAELEDSGVVAVEFLREDDARGSDLGLLTSGGAAGLLFVDLSPFEPVERGFGAAPYVHLISSIQNKALELARKLIPNAEIHLLDPRNAHQLALVAYRPRSDRSFYLDALPAIPEQIAEQLPVECRRILYPFMSGPVTLHAGQAMVFYDPALSEARQLEKAVAIAAADARLRRDRTAELRRGELTRVLIQESVHSVYEKVVDLRSMAVIGFEALVRGPAESLLATPFELFRTAEAAGLTFQLDCLCRTVALRGVDKRFQPQHKLFLNCLPSAIHDPNFRDEALVRTLASVGLHPKQIVFEVSESEAMKNFPIFSELREHFRNLGFQFALDDTGAGYSSLAALMELAPEYIKIDRSLVRKIDTDPSRQALLRALKEVGDHLGASLIAEGIETNLELEKMQQLGIQHGQGFFFGKGLVL